MFTSLSMVQDSKVPFPSSRNPSGKDTVHSMGQSEKALSPIFVTWDGIVSEVRN